MTRTSTVTTALLAIAALGTACAGSKEGPVAPQVVAPQVTTQPQNITTNAGQAANFTVVASGTSPLTYQWRKDGGAIGSATSASYTIAAATAGDAGTYSVVITNSAGSVTSNGATLTVNTPPTITTQPQAATVNAGQAAAFTVTATGTAPLTYQWRRNAVNLAGATSGTLNIASAAAGDAGTYDVVVTNAAGTVTSTGAVLTVNGPPTISAQPQSVSVRVGLGATFSVTAAGTGPLTYQWRKGGTPIAGATTSTYSIPTTVLGDAGSFDVVVSNAFSSVTSNAATLTVTIVGISMTPLAPNVGTLGTQRFIATVTGTNVTTVAWNVLEAGGGTVDASGNYTAPATAGTYHVKATANDDNTKSVTATVTVFAAGTLRLYQTGLPLNVFAVVHLVGPAGFTADLTQADASVVAPVGAYVATVPNVTSGGTTFQPVEPGPTLNLTVTLNNTLLTGVSFAPLAPAGVGAIATTGSTVQDHIAPGAVLLPNGHVLATGGLTATTEDYDPNTGVWTTVGSHGGTVDFFTPLALMSNGKVILASGGYPTPSVTTWIYDPTPKTWSQAASLSVARTNSTVTPLANGKVLVTGGTVSINGNALASAELYDPVGNTWTTVGSMSAARAKHTATLLANGKVLIVGGIAGSVSPGTAELFDPLTNQFTVVTSTPIGGRWSHQAVLLPNGKVVIVGGAGNGALDIELFDPVNNTFSSNARIRLGRLYVAASLLADGRVFINGGSAGDAMASTEIYNPTSGAVVFGPNLTVSRQEHVSVTLQNGKVLIVGGRGVNNVARRVVDLFTP